MSSHDENPPVKTDESKSETPAQTTPEPQTNTQPPQPLSNPSDTTTTEPNSNMTELLRNMSEVVKSIGGMGRTVPTYDPNHKGATSIRSHIKMLEKMADRYQWSEKTRVHELILSLRGQARKIAEAWPPKTSESYAETKKQLIEAFSKDKPAAIQMRQWSMYSWQSDKQSIVEFATLLKAKLNKIARNTGQDTVSSELFLKNRLMEAIKEENPKFSKFIELNRDEKLHNTYEKLYKFIQEKWDIYKTEEEENEERESTNILFNAETMGQIPRNMQKRYPSSKYFIDERFAYIPNGHQRIANQQQQTGQQYGYTRFMWGDQYPRNYNGYQRQMYKNYPTNYNTTYKPSTFSYYGRYPTSERQPRLNTNERFIVSNRGPHDYYSEVPRQIVNQFQHEKPQKYIISKQNKTYEKRYKDGDRKDKSQINRGTKVEEGQKVQFLERVKENQKN